MTGEELARDVRNELRELPERAATTIARHLVMAGLLLDDAPEEAYAHAAAARSVAPRIGASREALGLAAYRTGRYAEALTELRTARRMSGSSAHLPVLADAERGLGRPERAIALAGGAEARGLDREAQLELRIVAAGARRDLGQPEAAVVTLQVPELRSERVTPGLARLRYAYADALLAAGRRDEAESWFARAAEADVEEETDAGERLAELQGVTFVDALDDSLPEDPLPDEVDAGAQAGQPTQPRTLRAQSDEIDVRNGRHDPARR